MNPKTLIWIGVFVGGMLGSYIPNIWGAGLFSFSSVIFSTLGSVVGIWLGWKLSQMF